jgi:hypothetical protein
MMSRESGLRARNIAKRATLLMAALTGIIVACTIGFEAIGVGMPNIGMYLTLGSLVPLVVSFLCWLVVLCIYFVQFTLRALVIGVLVLNVSLGMIFATDNLVAQTLGAMLLALLLMSASIYVFTFDPGTVDDKTGGGDNS